MRDGDLLVPEVLYKQRKVRMQKLLILEAPAILIRHEARLLLAAVHETRRSRFSRWYITHAPHWWLMLTNKAYRGVEKGGGQ